MLLNRLQQIGGIVIVLLILLDVFLTVLYARMGSGLLSPRLARGIWHVFRVLARSSPRHCARIASFCGPVILVSLVFVWMAGLTLGNALLFHPVLGSAIRSSNGKTPTDFVSALYAGGSSISIVGSADFSPAVPRYRLVYLFNSIVGLSVTSLTLTYLMQIYNQLQLRNTFALKVYLATRGTGDAAVLARGPGAGRRVELRKLCALGVRGGDGGHERGTSLLPGAVLHAVCRTVLLLVLYLYGAAGCGHNSAYRLGRWEQHCEGDWGTRSDLAGIALVTDFAGEDLSLVGAVEPSQTGLRRDLSLGAKG